MLTPETSLTKTICDYLILKGYTVKKIYNGGTPARVINNKIIFKKKPEMYKGIPDLLAYNEKSFFFIEVKRQTGTVKPDQKKFIEDFTRCKKHEAVVVRSLENVIEILKDDS